MATQYTPACPICATTNVGYIDTNSEFSTQKNPCVYVRMECYHCEAKWTSVFTCRGTLDITPGYFVEFAN